MKFLSRDYKKYKNDYLFHKSAGMLKLEFYFKQYEKDIKERKFYQIWDVTYLLC